MSTIDDLDASLWLELKFEDATRVFEFGPDDERVIVVGSLLRADVRVDRVGVKPVHFQFERVGHDVRIVPAYGSDVRLSGELLLGPHPLHRHSLLEFSGIRMAIRVLHRFPERERDKTIADGSFAVRAWSSHEAVAVLAPTPVRTADPRITITSVCDDDTEITEDFPPPATPELEGARSSSAPSLDATAAVSVPKPRATSEPWANSEPLSSSGPRTGRSPVAARIAPHAAAMALRTLAFILLVAIVVLVQKCAASGL